MIELSDLAGRVTCYEDRLILPTYSLRSANPNPVFRSQYGVAHIYPYTLLDDFAAAPEPHEYRLLVLENRYLRIQVLPELGGRVYSLYDKLAENEVFYKNNVVKFSPLAIRGAFFSGGLEFSFPVAHAPTTADPVNWHMRQNEDGSASISIGGLEHLNQMRWTITLTLYPDRCALAQDVALYNPSTLPGRYHYWTNASLVANDQTQFIYPLRRARSYEYAGTSSWPYSRLDLVRQQPGLPGMEGVPLWPAERMHAPINFRWQKNMLAQVSIFGRQVEWDFFGAWQGKNNIGYAHYADHRDVAGMKLWSWGNAPFGIVNQSALTDDGSLYAETQCGAMETQLDFAFLQPDELRSWREWWLPLRRLRGLTCASSEIGARLAITPGQPQVQASLGLCPARDLGRAEVKLSTPQKTLFSTHLPLSPENPYLTEFNLLASDVAGYPLQLVVYDQQGQTVLDYSLDRETNPVPDEAQRADTDNAARELFNLGARQENFDNREAARKAFEQVLELNSQDAAAHMRLGLLQLRAAQLGSALGHFEQAAKAGAAGANYYAGQAAILMDDLPAARRYFEAVPQDVPRYLSARLALAGLELRQGDFRAATERFEQARQGQPASKAARLGFSLALRLSGNPATARQSLLDLLRDDPLNLPALRELAFTDPDGEHASRLELLLADDRQYILDLACYYFRLGALGEALQVLGEHAASWEYPPAGWLAVYLAHLLADAQAEKHWTERSQAFSLDYAFPSRLEEVVALEYALKNHPGDARLSFMLGNFMYSRERFSEATGLWEQALAGLPDNDVLLRNLGLAAWQRQADLAGAAGYFQQALAANPLNQDCYLHLDDLYTELQDSEARSPLLESMQKLRTPREDVRKRCIRMLVELDRHEEALRIMETEHFEPLEMDQSFHDLFVQANLKRAALCLERGDIPSALAAYQAALSYPANLGVGEPTTSAQAQVYYRLGLAYESEGRFAEALDSWKMAAREHHPHGSALFTYVQMALDKLSRYSEIGME